MQSENFFKFMKYYGQGRKIKLAGFFVLSLIAGALEFIGIALLYPFILLIIRPESVIYTKYYKDFIAHTGQANILVNAFILGFIIIFIFISKNIFMIFCTWLQNKFIANWKLALSKKFMYYYLYSPYKNSLESSASEKIYNLGFLVNQTLDAFVFRIIHLATNIVITVMIIALLLIKFPSAAIITGIFVMLSLYTYKKIFKEKMAYIAANFSKLSMQNTDRTLEIINNIKELKILCSEDYFFDKFCSNQKDYNGLQFKNNFYNSIPPYILEIFVVLALVVLAGIISIQNAEHTSWMIASYTIVAAAIFRVAPAVNRIQVSLSAINNARGFVKNINEQYEKMNLDFAKPKTDFKIKFENKITLKDINFSYKKKMVIKDLNLDVNKGEFIGIIGLSGAGKSTLADIIMGLLPVNSGEIFVDSRAITQENFSALRKLVGYVPQQINILDGSFKRNIAWGVNENEINEKKVVDVLKKAQLYKFVNEFDEGINAKVILGSSGLSQGQKQRLAIARALYRNPAILIFDEATSSLDVETENEITTMLNALKGDKTIIAIAHRLSTLKSCDRLIYLKDGKIVDTGSFEELSKRHADFEKLVKLSSIGKI